MSSIARRREKGEISGLERSFTVLDVINNTTTVYDQAEIANQNGEHKYMFDWVTSNYDQLSARGKIINSPMHSIKTTRSSAVTDNVVEQWAIVSGVNTHGATYTRSPDPWLTGPTLGPISHVYTDIDIGQLRTLAGTQAQANIDAPEFQGVVFAAELKETLGFLLSPLRSYQRWLKKKLRKERQKRRKSLRGRRGRSTDTSNLDKAKTLADLVSNNWLSYRYGALPIVYDMQDAIAAITALSEVTNRATARGFASNYGTNSRTQNWDNGWAFSEKLTTTKRTVQVRAGILYEVDNRDTFGVNINQLPVAAWEVVPFSFVADWFVNVNDFLGGIYPVTGINVLSSWTMVRDLNESEAQGFTTGDPLRTDLLVPNDSTSAESLFTEDKNRNVGHAYGLATQPIPFHGDIGTKRALDAMALVFQLLKTKI